MFQKMLRRFSISKIAKNFMSKGIVCNCLIALEFSNFHEFIFAKAVSQTLNSKKVSAIKPSQKSVESFISAFRHSLVNKI